MRQIKFRAWDTERNQFVPQGEIIFSDYGDTNIEVHPNDLSYVGDSCHNGEPQRGRFIITQFTGLKDKNGKEIYEGDIINGRYGISVVRFIDCGFHPLCGEINSEKDTDIIEVIGNIYENPDLLK